MCPSHFSMKFQKISFDSKHIHVDSITNNLGDSTKVNAISGKNASPFAKGSSRLGEPEPGTDLERRRSLLFAGRLVEGLLEDVLGLLERFDLLRARGFAVLVGRVAVHAPGCRCLKMSK